MSVALERIAAEALELPSSERATLAHRLIASLDEGPADDPIEVELAWEAEIRRRLEACRRGDEQTVPASDVFAKARASFSLAG